MSSAAGSEDAIEFERRGLYDPAAADAFERLAILRELVALGATTDELAAARDELAWLAVRVVLRPGPRELTLAELAGATGVTEERAAMVWRAAGFPRPTPDARPFSEADVELLRSVEAGAVLFGDDTILQMVRVMGSAMARVADTVISAFLVNVSSRLAEHDAGDLVHARANLGIQELVPQLTAAVDVLLRHHLEALRRPGGAVIARRGITRPSGWRWASVTSSNRAPSLMGDPSGRSGPCSGDSRLRRRTRSRVVAGVLSS